MIKILSASQIEVDRLENWPGDWPDKENRVSQHDVTREQLVGFTSLLKTRPAELEIERFLSANKEVLSMTVWLFSTGHHMSWVFSKPEIKGSINGSGGLIPDYLLAGANSDGVRWFALELKGENAKAFHKSAGRAHLSSEANKGICQLLSYIDSLARDQAYHRENKLAGMRQPTGILMIGTEDETSDLAIRDFKQAWNRENPRLQIRSYHALLRQLESKLVDFGR